MPAFGAEPLGARGTGRVGPLPLPSPSATFHPLHEPAAVRMSMVRKRGQMRRRPHSTATTSMRGPDPSVVVGCDGSEESDALIAFGAAESQARQLPLRLLHVVVTPGGTDLTGDDLSASWADRSRTAARDTRGGWAPSADTVPPARFAVRLGSPVGELVAAAPAGSLLVVGSDRHERGRPSGVVGGAVAARAQCPVVILPRGRAAVPTRRVVVGFKNEGDSVAALEEGFRNAAARGLPLLVVHAAGSTSREQRDRHRADLERSLSVLRLEHATVSVRTHVLDRGFLAGIRSVALPDDMLFIGRSTAWTTHPGLGTSGAALSGGPPCPTVVVPPLPLRSPVGPSPWPASRAESQPMTLTAGG